MSKRRTTSMIYSSSLRRTPLKRRYKRKRHRLNRCMRTIDNGELVREISYEVNKHQSTPRNVLGKSKKTFDVIYAAEANDPAETNAVDKTIDLCDDSSDEVQERVPVTRNEPEVIIDLCKEPNEEIIVLGEKLKETGKLSDEGETTLVDLQENNGVEKKTADSNDDILVIGSFSKRPLSSSTSNKINYFFRDITKLNKTKKRSKFQKDRNRNNFYKQEDFRVKPKRTTNTQYTTSKVGENIYVSSPVNIPNQGLRPIIIDGSNVAMGNVKNRRLFSCKRLDICIRYFKERGHKVTAFVPQFRTLHNKSDDPELLNRLANIGDVILTPSKRVEGKNIVPYDDRFIVQTAVLQGGIIVTRDNYRDLLVENPTWAETINYRTLPYTWVGDLLIFPKDPLGEHGPSLEEFLRFP